MPDGRRNNGGHSTKGKAGRPPKADEIKMIERMDATLAPAKAWEALAKKVEKGDTQAIKCWLEYRYGKPSQSIDMTSGGEKVHTPVISFIKTGEGED